MRPGGLRLSSADLLLTGVGALLLVAASYVSVHVGARIGAGTVVVIALFCASAVMYVRVPHLALAGTILLFALVPAMKVFISPQIGGVKDLVCIAAIAAGLFLVVFERRRTDRTMVILVLLLLGMYVVNIGDGHGTAWAQGVRLIGEPLLLLLTGMLLPNPQRNLRYAMAALIATGCLVAAYGLIQQALGQFRLVDLGYSFSLQVRTISGHLRSFGTLDDPFAYAALLLFAIAAVFFWLRRGPIALATVVLLLLGLAASYVRTSLLVLVGLGALLAVRSGRGRPALFLGAAAVVVSIVVLTKAGGTETQPFTVYSTKGGSYLIPRPVPQAGGVLLNGRVSAWKNALGDKPAEWVFGRGVGKVGTAAARATVSLFPGASSNSTSDTGSDTTSNRQLAAVDSGYLATIADVGIVGLIVLLAILARATAIGWRAASKGSPAGWIALGLLVSMVIDALTRASFTGFPTAFLGLLLLGVCLAAARSGETRRRDPFAFAQARMSSR